MGESLTAGLRRQQAGIASKMESATGDQLKKLVGKSKNVAKELSHRQAARDAGITSLPGIAKGLATKPVDTAKAMWRHTSGGGRAGTALALGVPAAFAANDLRKGDESAAGGKTVGQKIVRHGAQLGTSVITGGMSLVPGMVTSTALETGVGKAYDKLRGHQRPTSFKRSIGEVAANTAGRAMARRVADAQGEADS